MGKIKGIDVGGKFSDIIISDQDTGEIALSHQISGEYREYGRTSTTLINAYIQNHICNDLAELELGLGELGFEGALFTTRSGGGYGRPSERKIEDIAFDLDSGYVTEDFARQHYHQYFQCE